MADSPVDPDTDDETAEVNDSEPASGTPLWVKVFGIIAAIFVLMFVVLLLVGGNHGPGRHSYGGTGAALSSSVKDDPGPPSGLGHGGQQS